MPPSHGGDRGFESRWECHNYFMFIVALCQKQDHRLGKTDHNELVRKGKGDQDQLASSMELVRQVLVQEVLRKELVRQVHLCDHVLRGSD